MALALARELNLRRPIRDLLLNLVEKKFQIFKTSFPRAMEICCFNCPVNFSFGSPEIRVIGCCVPLNLGGVVKLMI